MARPSERRRRTVAVKRSAPVAVAVGILAAVGIGIALFAHPTIEAGGAAPPVGTASPTAAATNEPSGAPPTVGATTAAPPTTAAPTTADPTTAASSPTPTTDDAILRYKQRCVDATKTLLTGKVVWQPRYDMVQDEETAIAAGIAASTDIPTGSILPEASSPSSETIRFACRVEADLLIDTESFAVSDSTPLRQEVQVVDGGVNQWHWLTTPRSAGTYTMYLELHPVVALENEQGRPPSRTDLPSVTYASQIHVTKHAGTLIGDAADSWTQWLVRIGAFLAALLAVLSGASKLIRGSWIPGRGPGTAQESAEPESPDLDKETLR